jgi:hypothetical protein
MFLSAPNTYYNEAAVPTKYGVANMTRNLFTEVDHNYINPITNRAQNIRKVVRYFSDIDKWNRRDGYRRAALTFNEYMTWGVYLMFAYDFYNQEKFTLHLKNTIELMKYRGFYRFEDFAELAVSYCHCE